MEQDDMVELLVNLQVKREILKKTIPDIDHRLIRWGLLALKQENQDFQEAALLRQLEGKPESWQWARIKQRLSRDALESLDKKMSDKIKDLWNKYN
jgi:hypothetical protein